MLAVLGVACSGRSDRRIRFRQRLHLNRSEHKFLLADKQNEGLLSVRARRSRLFPVTPNEAGSLSAVDFTCVHDQSTPQMRADSVLESCCCRVRCGTDVGCSAGQRACSAEPLCSSVSVSGRWATLKSAALWWHGAEGVERCLEIDEASRRRPAAMRRAWNLHHCDDYTHGPQLRANRTHKLVFDIGLHSGEDTLHFLQQGHDVLAIDANPEMVSGSLDRPALHIAHQHGRLNALACGISDHRTKKALSFYVHKTISEWSSFTEPRGAKRSQFSTISIPVTTCGDLIRQFGVPFYMKVDIEGSDEACLRTLKQDSLPLYVSTEDPSQLDYLISLGYCAFKMVSQHMARRGGRQFSGGMPDEAPGVWGNAESIRKHPFFSRQHMHERIDHNGNRLREEHDLHARLQICL